MFEKQNRKLTGFYTEEVRGEGGKRTGFDIVLVNKPEKRSSLARATGVLNQTQYSKHRVGDYHVYLNNFEAMALPVFEVDTDVLFIDEIGKMELFSQKFHDRIQKLFFGPPNEVRVIATIPQLHKVPQRYLPLFQKFQADDKSKIINVTKQNRDSLPNTILDLIS